MILSTITANNNLFIRLRIMGGITRALFNNIR